MNTLQSSPENCTQGSETSCLADDWNLPETSISADTASYDGKIIARMPDLGSNEFIKKIEKPTYASVWDRFRRSAVSVKQSQISELIRRSIGNRQQLFQHITVFGGVVLLCGVGILVLDHNNDKSFDPSVNVADIVSENTAIPSEDTFTIASHETAFPPERESESNTVLPESSTAIPVADIAAVQNSVAQSSAVPPTEQSAWNRPAADTYSPWNVASKQHTDHQNTLSISNSADVAAAPPIPAALATPVPPAVSQETADTVAMVPMTALSMPVSPYERQLFVAQSEPTVRPPVDPFIQSSVQPNLSSGQSPVLGMVQTHGRIENGQVENMNPIPQGVPAPYQQQRPVPQPPSAYHPQPYYQQPYNPQPYYQQQPMPQRGTPMNAVPPYSANPQGQHIQHGQFGQYDPYAAQNAAQTSAAAKVAVSSNRAIPSGVSTLPPHNGYYQQSVESGQMQNNPFHSNVPSAYQRIY